MASRTTGLDSLEAKLKAIPPEVQAAVRKANEQNALDFMSAVARIIPVEHGTLVGTLEKGPGKTPLAVRVSIGGPEAPYPAHLEFGHRDPGGGHVHAEPFWFTTLRVNRRRYRSRTARAGSDAIKKFRAG